MQARRASRELALILFSQLGKDLDKYSSTDFKDIVLNSIRTLIGNSEDELQLVTSELSEFKDYITEYENNHKDNLERPLDAPNIPVKVPMTDSMVQKIDTLLSSAEKTLSALEVAELSILSDRNDVKKYVELIFKTYKDKKPEIDNIIKQYAIGWDIERLFKIDKDILRIAIVELVYIKDAPVKVVIDEALELAKKYSTDESPSFINGILAKVVESYV
ncbi:TPA: transcription antitermination factor NusB [Candidatus Galligastranaerophilus gallistercoris]|nr:transcription antitermination factor NusB [Candidatus Galligastranaerophilus gallistercoris]